MHIMEGLGKYYSFVEIHICTFLSFIKFSLARYKATAFEH